MSELNQGTPSADNAVEVPVVDTTPPVEAPPQAASQPPQPTIPPKYAGKSAEELARMLEAQEQHIGKQGQELGELRQKSQSYEQMLAQMQFMAQQQAQTAHQAPAQAPDEDLGKFDWENPDKAVDRRVERKLQKDWATLRQQLLMETAVVQAPMAKELAKAKYPDVFKGITDTELDAAMFGGARTGNVLPENLTKPRAWAMVAQLLQGEKNDYKTPVGVTPVDATATETPRGTKPQNYGEEPVVVDDVGRGIIKGFGMDEAEYLRNRRAERKAGQ